jgi:hypothetical protein
MKSKEVKINKQYLFNNEIVTVVETIAGKLKKWTPLDNNRGPRIFILSNGIHTKAKFLSPIINT